MLEIPLKVVLCLLMSFTVVLKIYRHVNFYCVQFTDFSPYVLSLKSCLESIYLPQEINVHLYLLAVLSEQ